MSERRSRNGAWACLLIAVLLLAFGCGGKDPGEKAGEKAMEKYLEKATGQKTDLDIEEGKVSIKTEGGTTVMTETTEWPDDLPGGVPLFGYGSVERVNRTKEEVGGRRTANIWLRDIEEGALEKYDADLKKAGWQTSVVQMGGKGGMIQAQKGEVGLTYVFNGEERRGNVNVYTINE